MVKFYKKSTIILVNPDQVCNLFLDSFFQK